MKRAAKVAAGLMLIRLFSPVAAGAGAVAAIAIAAHQIESGFIGHTLGLRVTFGLPSLFMWLVGVQLVRGNIKEPRKLTGQRAVNEQPR